MKRLGLILLLFNFQTQDITAQQSQQSQWKEVKVGNTMPDITLGTVVNNNTGKTKFSEFKGKLVILDFWNSGCSACIDNFPHMSELQKQFGDRIQIFLVNDVETQEEIESYFSRAKKYKNKKLIPDNLPSIVSKKHGDNVLNDLFPLKGETGYHVWIDGNGTVILRGPGYINTYEEKIENYLVGKKITYVTDEGVMRDYDDPGPLYALLPKVNRPIIQYNSIITRLADEIASYTGIKRINQIDSVTETVRTSFLNYSIVDLYRLATEDERFKEQQKVDVNYKTIRPILNVNDRAKYTSYTEDFLSRIEDDKWLRKNAFCYEQVAPLNFSEQIRRKYMLEDLNRFFGNLYGVEGKVEKIKTNCWVIIKKSTFKIIKPDSDDGRFERKEINENGKRLILYRNVELHNVLRDIAETNKTVFKTKSALPLIDGTKYDDLVNVKLSMSINSIEELRKALHSYGLDVVKQQREIIKLVLREKN